MMGVNRLSANNETSRRLTTSSFTFSTSSFFGLKLYQPSPWMYIRKSLGSFVLYLFHELLLWPQIVPAISVDVHPEIIGFLRLLPFPRAPSLASNCTSHLRGCTSGNHWVPSSFQPRPPSRNPNLWPPLSKIHPCHLHGL